MQVLVVSTENSETSPTPRLKLHRRFFFPESNLRSSSSLADMDSVCAKTKTNSKTKTERSFVGYKMSFLKSQKVSYHKSETSPTPFYLLKLFIQKTYTKYLSDIHTSSYCLSRLKISNC